MIQPYPQGCTMFPAYFHKFGELSACLGEIPVEISRIYPYFFDDFSSGYRYFGRKMHVSHQRNIYSFAPEPVPDFSKSLHIAHRRHGKPYHLSTGFIQPDALGC